MPASEISPADLLACPCPVCGSENRTPQFKVKGFQIVSCNDCSLVYVHPRLTNEAIFRIYSKNYFRKPDYNFNDFGYGNYDLTARLRDKTFQRWYHEFLPALKSKKGKALDVGCATGRFLNILKTEGWNAEGIELDQDTHPDLQARGFKVHSTPIESMPSDQRFDLITLFDVVEHITDLHGCFRNLGRMLEKDGSVVIVTPQIDSRQSRLFGKKWFQFKPWEHIVYFSPKTLGKIADEHGFRIVQVSPCGQYADMSFIHHRLQRYQFHRLSAIFGKILLLPGLRDWALYMSTGSMLVVLQRK